MSLRVERWKGPWVHLTVTKRAKTSHERPAIYTQPSDRTVSFAYGRPFVSKLWHDLRAVFSNVYLQSFPLHDIRAVFCHVYLRSFLLCGVYMTIFLQTRIYMRYKQAGVYGATESRRIRGTELYRKQKNPPCTMELKSNYSLNQA